MASQCILKEGQKILCCTQPLRVLQYLVRLILKYLCFGTISSALVLKYLFFGTLVHRWCFLCKIITQCLQSVLYNMQSLEKKKPHLDILCIHLCFFQV